MEITIIEQAHGVRWQQRAGIWIGIGINPASITLGGGLASRLPLSALVWLMPVGAVILVSLVVIMAIIGRRRRKPLAQLSAGVLGLGLGALLLNLIMGLGMVGWSGFQLGLSGTGVANLLRAPWWLGVGLMAGLFYWFSTLNVNRWNALVWITTLSSLALAVVALIAVAGREVVINATAVPFSLGAALWVLGSVVAYGSLFTLRVSDFSWDMDTDRDVIFDGVALLITLVISMFIGVQLFRTTGDWNLAEILAGTSLAWLGHLFLATSLLGPALSTIHSGGLAWKHVLPISQQQGAILLILIGLGLGLVRFDRQLLLFLDWVAAVAPPAVVTIIAATVLKRRGSAELALVAWIAGALVGLGFKINGQLVYLVAGASTSLLIFWLGQIVRSRPRFSKE